MAAVHAIIALMTLLSLQPVRDDRLAMAAQSALPGGAAIVLDIAGGRVFCLHGGPLIDRPTPAGSLLKLFTAWALLDAGASADDIYTCAPSSVAIPSTKSCWYKPGHGNLAFAQALAFSCNAWFRQWLAEHDPAPALALFARLRLADDATLAALERPADALCGFTAEIRPTMRTLAAAAACLFTGGIRLDLDGVKAGERGRAVDRLTIASATLRHIRAGMAEASREGTGIRTASSAGLAGALSKTGTSPHLRADGNNIDPAATDGWCLVLYPADKPRLLILVLQPGGRGALQAADAAAVILKAALAEGMAP